LAPFSRKEKNPISTTKKKDLYACSVAKKCSGETCIKIDIFKKLGEKGVIMV
jgi:hypothetical protein